MDEINAKRTALALLLLMLAWSIYLTWALPDGWIVAALVVFTAMVVAPSLL